MIKNFRTTEENRTVSELQERGSQGILHRGSNELEFSAPEFKGRGPLA